MSARWAYLWAARQATDRLLSVRATVGGQKSKRLRFSGNSPPNLIYCITYNFTTSRVIAILSSAIDFLGKISLMQLFNTLCTNLALLRLHLPFFVSPLLAYLASLQLRTLKLLAHTL